MEAKTLSVIVYTRNHRHHVGECLESILGQSHAPLEVIVVDDASADQTPDIVRRLRQRHRTIRLVEHPQPLGRWALVNRALSVSRGDCVYLADAEARLLPGTLERSLSLLAKHPDAGFCYFAAGAFDFRTRTTVPLGAPWSDTAGYHHPADLARILRGVHPSPHQAIVNRRVLIDHSGYLECLEDLADWFTLTTIALRTGACFEPTPGMTRFSSTTTPPLPSNRSDALKQVLRLLRSEPYRDVLGPMIAQKLLLLIRPEVEELVLTHPEHWEVESLLLIDHPLDLANAKNRVRALTEQGKNAVARGDLDEAQRIYLRGSLEFPHLHSFNTLFAKVAFARGDYSAAAQALSRVSEIAPDDPELHLQRGIAHYGLGRYVEAEKAFRVSLELDPTNLTAVLNLAEVLQALGRDEEAARHYNEQLRTRPDNPDLLTAVGRLALRMDQAATARIAYRNALELQPGCEEAHQVLHRLNRHVQSTPSPFALPSATGRAADAAPTPRPLPSTTLPVHFLMVVWGEAYRELFLNVVLPTELSPGNLFAFRNVPECRYRIYTTPEDARAIEAAPIYAALCETIRTEIVTIENLDIGDKYRSMGECHRHAVAAANKAGAAMMILGPDAIASDGTFARCAELVTAGKRAVMIPGVRAVKESFVRAFVDRPSELGSDVGGGVGSRDLVKLGLDHLHPFSKALFWNAPEFTSHPSILLWPVADRGVLARCFHMHPQIIHPELKDVVPPGTLDAEYLNFACPNPDDIYVVQDSDEMAAVELSSESFPVGTTRSEGANVFDVARWASVAATPLHRDLFRRWVFFHTGEIDEEWQQIGRASDEVVESILFFSEGLSVDRSASCD